MTKAEELAQITGNEPIKPEKKDYNESFENSPIWIRGNEETGYFATLADFRITETYQTIEDVETLLYNKDWEILLNIITTIVEMTLKAKNIK